MFPLFLIVLCIFFHYSVLRVRFYNKIKKNMGTGCPICRADIQMVMRVHNWQHWTLALIMDATASQWQ